MLFSVPERLTVLSLLPQEGNFLTLALMRKLREALSFDEKELKEFSIVEANNRVTWDNNAAADKEIEVGDSMNALIVDRLKELDKAKKLTNAHVTLYEKFVLPVEG